MGNQRQVRLNWKNEDQSPNPGVEPLLVHMNGFNCDVRRRILPDTSVAMAASTGKCNAMLSDKNRPRPDADGGDVSVVKYNGKGRGGLWLGR